MVEVCHEEHVLFAGDEGVDGGELSGDADGGAYGLGVGGQVVAVDVEFAGVGGDEGGEDLHGGGLARAVRAEQSEHTPGRNREVDPVEDRLVPVGLA